MTDLDAEDVDSIEFGVYSREEIINMAVCKVDKVGLSGPGTVYDKAMGCVTGTNEECVTCKQKKECWGHFGYIELNEPILHPLYYKLAVAFLKCVCKRCYRLLILDDYIELRSLQKLKGKNRFTKLLNILSKIDICSHCSQPQPKVMYKVKDNTINLEYKQKKGDGKISIVLDTQTIKEIFDNITDDVVVMMGLDPKRIHPRNLVLTVFPVIPPCSRPPVIAEGNICDDDLTYQLLQIVMLNKQLAPPEDDKTKPITEQKRQQIIQSLRFRISTMINNSHGKAKHPTDSRPIKCLKTRLAGKGGRIRSNLMGKRVNYSARTVIGADPTLKLGEVGIPYEVSKILTKPEVVNRYNVQFLQNIVDNGEANFIIKKRKDGTTTRINLEYAINRKGTELQNGDVIVRGDIQLIPDKNGKVKIPYSTKGVEVEIMTEKCERELDPSTTVIHKNKYIVVQKTTKAILKPGDAIVKGEFVLQKDKRDNYIIPSSSSPVEVIYITTNREVLKEGDYLVRNNELVDIVFPVQREIKLVYGDVVERQLRKGDIVLFNRQPTLWKGSMMAMKVVPSPPPNTPGHHRTFRFNLSVAGSFNADFDGDEMNIHAPQSYDAEAELRNLSTPMENMISGQQSKPNVVIVQDSLLASFLMTRYDFELTRTQFIDISTAGSRPDGTPLWNADKIKKIERVLKQFKKKPFVYNGRGLMSLILPDDFYYEYSNDAHPNEPVVKIYGGVFVEGAIDKKVVGSSYKSIILHLHKEYGTDICAKFVDNIQFITNKWMLYHGFSIGLEDCMITSPESISAIEDTLVQCYTKAEGIEQETKNSKIREVRITAALSQAKDVGMNIAKNAMRSNNNFLATVNSGAKGDFFNIAQLTGLLGQQNLEGQRVKPTLNHGKRTLPHYPYENLSKEREYESRGFIRHSFIHGLCPEEFFFHAMSGREGICDTAMGTADSGYTQRKIIKACEDIQVQYDHTVRDVIGKIYQFNYGMDPCKTVMVGNTPQFCDIDRIVNKLNTTFEEDPLTFKKKLVDEIKNKYPLSTANETWSMEELQQRMDAFDTDSTDSIIEEEEEQDKDSEESEEEESEEEEDDDNDSISSIEVEEEYLTL
jgi:DNA-directed RNA polymerase III subunit RPC1